ncbi:MAG: hypothetical protein MI757_05065 [Pirellulales bacterium]|nr:hypothetical protein [Pirellulales bacterium]
MFVISTTSGRTAFEPGESVEVNVEWLFEQQPESVELRLVWYTRGKGDTDISVVERVPFEFPSTSEKRTVELQLPMAPYSFSGKLISLCWSIELVADDGDASERLDITMAPGAREVTLHGGE